MYFVVLSTVRRRAPKTPDLQAHGASRPCCAVSLYVWCFPSARHTVPRRNVKPSKTAHARVKLNFNLYFWCVFFRVCGLCSNLNHWSVIISHSLISLTNKLDNSLIRHYVRTRQCTVGYYCTVAYCTAVLYCTTVLSDACQIWKIMESLLIADHKDLHVTVE